MSDQPSYSESDLHIISDAVGFVRRRREMFLRNGVARAEDLVQHMLSDMLWLDALPAKVERVGMWWVVSSAKEWLFTYEGEVSLDVFRRIVPMPRRAQNDHRADIVITAFAKAVVTTGPEGVTWIVGDPVNSPLPSEMQLSPGAGRTVAFTLGA